jgi:ABC-2 type transport system permease protein
MYNLIIKDIRSQKYWLILCIALVCLFQYTQVGFLLAVYIFITNYIISAHQIDAKEGKSTYHKFINSLPYSRQKIILSKYIGGLLAGIAAVLITLIVQLPNYPLELEQLREVWAGLVSAMVFASFYLPICYRFRNMYLPLLFMTFFVGVFVAWNQINEWINISSYIQKMNESLSMAETITYTSIFVGLLYVASYWLTVKIYERTDF